MRPILAGLDTEYGFSVEGHGAEDQVEDAAALVRSYPGERPFRWDDRFESPRNDLRGFRLDRLAYDPEDAKFDEGRTHGPLHDVRADQLLPNGARLYNDHGHPEYATPESWSLHELVLHDKAGDRIVCQAAEAFASETGREVRVYKNNTDFHGASYGTHESYLVPRSVPVENLIAGLTPLLVARQVLTGAGKVGAERGKPCDFQLSQRADFFVEPVNAETLYRRPVFNTRDEPHADPARWMRLHVICGESNMSAVAVRTKVALVKAALCLIEAGDQPIWRLSDAVRSFQQVSRDPDGEGRIEVEGRSWTTPRLVIESYIEPFLSCHSGQSDALTGELSDALRNALELLEARQRDPARFAQSVDWAAKRLLLRQYIEAEGAHWGDPALKSLDLEYHRLDGGQGLATALVEEGLLAAGPDGEEVESRIHAVHEPTRANARSIALSRFPGSVAAASWGSLTFRTFQGDRTVLLAPDRAYPDTLAECVSVEEFIMSLETAP